MRLVVGLDGDMEAWALQNERRWARGVTTAVADAAREVQEAWRAQVRGALGNRLAGTIRRQVFPQGQPSPNAAALVWSKAPDIVGAHARGVTIRSQNGFWLAIPTAAAGRGARGTRLTPGEWEARRGLRLRFVYRQGRTALLVADGARLNSRGLGVASRSKTGRGAATVPIFILVPQVRLTKRLDLDAPARAAGAGLPARIRAAVIAAGGGGGA
ncbi:MAG TPA: DUF6441 family protein [Paracoccaceae bacterium]|nr:DUF6441 family protein [Paracoccaceae bacterium]HMO72635.1 DUF6441 family protein [Paracoccaceae bacterium]